MYIGKQINSTREREKQKKITEEYYKLYMCTKLKFKTKN